MISGATGAMAVVIVGLVAINSAAASRGDLAEGNLVATVGDMLSGRAAEAAIAMPIAGAAHAASSDGASISGGLPQLFFLQYTVPPLTLEMLWIIFPFALTLAAVGLIESLMTLTLIDEITETRGRGNRECVGQGAANILCGLFGGMGGCAMIGQSLINVNSGGRRRLSGITAAVCLLLFILFLAPWIQQIPMAASVSSFKDLFEPSRDPDDVVIDFYYTRVYDQSGLEAINLLAEKYESCGKRLHLTHLSSECRSLLNRAGDFVDINVSEDPQYHVATDRLG